MPITDTRELDERLDELRDERDESGLDDADARELAELETLEAGIADWSHGATLIPEDEFEDYAREFAADIGAVDRDAGWPNSYIDWKAAAEALQMDYTAYEYQGTTYYTR